MSAPWLQLPDRFHDVVAPARFPEHRLRWRNDRAAAEIGLDRLDDAAWIDHFSRFEPLPDNLPEPLALRYHGHQFGHYNPNLGDGRGFLFAQLRARDGRWLDLGTKGSGPTPWSRGGDGKLTLQGGVREVLAAELNEARGVPTCRILSVVETGEGLWRNDEPSPTRSCVLVRQSHGHVRIGTFQRLATLRDELGLQALVDYCGTHLLGRPGLGAVDFVEEVGCRLVDLCARWLAAGFVHGVLNTDNLAITGESFDYGPWRFLPEGWDPNFTAAYFDHTQRYAFGRQLHAIAFGLRQLVASLAPIAPAPELEGAAVRALHRFTERFVAAWLRRLAIQPQGASADGALVDAIVAFLATDGASFDRFVFDWRGGAAAEDRALAGPAGPIYREARFEPVLEHLRRALPVPGRRPGGDAPVGLPDPEVKAIWAAIATDDDWGPFTAKVAAIRQSA